MKAAVALITIIIIACLVVSIGLLLWAYLNGYFSFVSQTGETRMQRGLETLSSCMRIEEAFQNKFFVRNCGQGVITNDTLNVYVDGESTNFSLNPVILEDGKTGTLSLKAWGMSAGQHYLRITSPNFETSTFFEANLPDSTILALDFDEGSGNIAHDSSANENDGTLVNSPSWSDGKFEKAVKFDGSSNYVEVQSSDSLRVTNQFTIECWLKPNRNYTEEANAWYGGLEKRDLDYRLGWQGWTDGITLEFYDEGGTRRYMDTTDVYLIQDQWHHIIGLYNGTHLKVYVNGNFIKEENEGSYNVRFSVLQSLRIGLTSSTYLNVTIDSVRVYNKALTPDETVNFRII